MGAAEAAQIRRLSPRASLYVVWALFVGALALTVWGTYSSGLLKQDLWSSTGIAQLRVLILCYAVWSAAWIALAPRWFWPASAALLLIYAAIVAGPLAILAVGWFLFSALVAGTLLLSRGEARAPAPAPLRLLAGVAAWMLLIWIAVRFPVNYAAVYAAAFGLPMALRPGVTAACCKEVLALISPLHLSGRRRAAMVAVAALPLLCHLLVSLKPEQGADGLAVHLMIPAWVSFHHYWHFDYRHIVWAVMPLGADWCYTAVYMLGGEYAARLLNFAFLCVIAAIVYSITRRFTKPATALLAVALFAAIPLVQLETGSLMSENVWAALIAGAFWSVALFQRTAQGRWLYLAAMLLGGAMASKYGSLAFVVPLAAFAAYTLLKSKPAGGRLRMAMIAVGVFALFGAPPYVFAWHTTGNPVFPFFNDVFKSPWFESRVRLVDRRWLTPLSPAMPYEMVFQSHKYLESRDGALGLHALILLALAPAAFATGATSLPLLALATVIVGCALTLGSVSYLRYIYPALPMLVIIGTAGFDWMQRNSRRLRAVAWAALLAGVAGNLYLLPSSGWMHPELLLNHFDKAQMEEYKRRTPVREITNYLNHRYPGEPAMFFIHCDIAGFHGRAYCVGWHNYRYQRMVQQARNAEELLALAQRFGISFFVIPRDWTPDPATVTDFVAKYTELECEHAGIVLLRLKRQGVSPLRSVLAPDSP
ncbi:MAG: ArnT family glycosyltransferase [bacterium]|jgi:hypothetical protein